MSTVTPGPTAKPKKKRTRTERPRPAATAPVVPEVDDFERGALNAFFEEYRAQGFDYDPTAVPPLEYRRLARHLGIFRRPDDSDPRSRPLWEAFGRAMTAEFGIKFGRNMNDLAAWQKLCRRIGIDPLPTSLKKARAVSAGR